VSSGGRLENGAAGGFYKGAYLGLATTTCDDPGLDAASSTVKADSAIHSAKLMYFLSDQHGSAPGMTKQISSSFGRRVSTFIKNISSDLRL